VISKITAEPAAKRLNNLRAALPIIRNFRYREKQGGSLQSNTVLPAKTESGKKTGHPIIAPDDFEVVAGMVGCRREVTGPWQFVPVVAISSLSEARQEAIRIADKPDRRTFPLDRDILAIEYQRSMNRAIRRYRGHGSFAWRDEYHPGRGLREKAGPSWSGGRSSPVVVAAPFREKVRFSGLLGSHRLLCGDARCE